MSFVRQTLEDEVVNIYLPSKSRNCCLFFMYKINKGNLWMAMADISGFMVME